jgi:hypothetical protein
LRRAEEHDEDIWDEIDYWIQKRSKIEAHTLKM